MRAVQDAGLGNDTVHQQGKNGAVPDPSERPVLEVQGAQAEAVMAILHEWCGNRRRKLALVRTPFVSSDRLRELRGLEEEIQEIERLIVRWRALGGGGISSKG